MKTILFGNSLRRPEKTRIVKSLQFKLLQIFFQLTKPLFIMETSNSTQTAPGPAKQNPAMSNPFAPDAAGAMPGGGPTVSRAFGEPISAQGRTIIPVALVAMGFRGGFWGKLRGAMSTLTTDPRPASDPTSAGAGRGGMMRRLMVRPVGFIDITSSGSRFVPIAPGRFVALGFALAFVVGGLVRGRRRWRAQG